MDETVMVVRCKECGEEHTSEEVIALNIEEDIVGRDVLTFECPVTNRTTTSFIFLKNQ